MTTQLYRGLPENRLAVVVGDVAGKGISAALLMAHLAAATRICLRGSPKLSDAVRQLNCLVLDAITDDRFITFVVAVLDSDQSRLTVINAGHLPPLLRRAGRNSFQVEELATDVAGLPLGVHDCQYRQFETTLEPGDSLLLYTDGVNEARNAAGELYGMDRLRSAMTKYQAILKEL